MGCARDVVIAALEQYLGVKKSTTKKKKRGVKSRAYASWILLRGGL